MKMASMAMALTAAVSGTALATPSTQIWIPSTDIQAFKTVHLGIDNYIRTTSTNGGANYFDIGVTAGVLPFEKLQAEIGVDYLDGGQNTDADKHPINFNAKVGTPEGSLFKDSPAIAAGIFGIGTQPGLTNANISYGLLAKTLPVVGRLSAGGFHGSESVLGSGKNNGLLASWDRTMSEIDDRLWLAVDYQSGNSAFGALSFGASWAFSKNVSLIVGYDIYNNTYAGGKPTFTTQLDINIP
jgi:hypothetical protein